MNEDTIERLAYRLIRRETRRFDRTTSDSELANYVRGVVDLQTELYGELSKQESTETEVQYYMSGYRDGETNALDQIRADIERIELLASYTRGDIKQIALDIIDKYRKGSENKE